MILEILLVRPPKFHFLRWSMSLYLFIYLWTFGNSTVVQAASTSQITATCMDFKFDGQQQLDSCDSIVTLVIPDTKEFSNGQTMQIILHSRVPQAPKITIEFSSVRPDITSIDFMISKMNGVAAGGSCSFTRHSSNRASGWMTCSSGISGIAKGDFFASYLIKNDLTSLDKFFGTIVNAHNLFSPLDPYKGWFAPDPNAKPALSGREILSGQVSEDQSNNESPTAHQSESFSLSDDRRAIFGLLVGAKGPERLHKCNESFLNDKPLMPESAPFCYSPSATGLSLLLGDEFNLSSDDYKTLGYSFINLIVNDLLFDTTFTESITIITDRTSTVIHKMSIDTQFVQHDEVLAMLTAKYGKPGNRDETIWTDRQTGREIGRTSNFYWDFGSVFIDYISRRAGKLDGSPTPVGVVYIYTKQFADAVAGLRNRQTPTDQPVRRPI